MAIKTSLRVPYSGKIIYLVLILSLFYFSPVKYPETVDLPEAGKCQAATDYTGYAPPRGCSKLPNPKRRMDPTLRKKEIFGIISRKIEDYFFGQESVQNPQKIEESECFNFTKIRDLDFKNFDWRHFETCKTRYKIFGVYNNKKGDVDTLPVVGIIAMVSKLFFPYNQCFGNPAHPLASSGGYHSYTWYNERESYQDGVLQPFMLYCCNEYSSFKITSYYTV